MRGESLAVEMELAKPYKSVTASRWFLQLFIAGRKEPGTNEFYE